MMLKIKTKMLKTFIGYWKILSKIEKSVKFDEELRNAENFI